MIKIKLYLRETGWDDVDRVYVAEVGTDGKHL
jgi:hypothetical protein